MFPCYSTPKVPDNERKGKRSGCKQTQNLSDQSVFLGLYFAHCKSFDSNHSLLYTSHRWRNKSEDCLNLGFLLSPPVSLLDQRGRAVKLLDTWCWLAKPRCPGPEISCRYYDWIHEPTYESWLCQSQNTSEAEDCPCPTPSSTLALNWRSELMHHSGHRTWQVEQGTWGWAFSVWVQLLYPHRSGERLFLYDAICLLACLV